MGLLPGSLAAGVGRVGLPRLGASSEEEDLLGAACQAEVLTVAKLTRESTNEIEAGHSAGKKLARRQSDLGRAIKLQDQSAQRMMMMLRGTPALHAHLWSDLSMPAKKGPNSDGRSQLPRDPTCQDSAGAKGFRVQTKTQGPRGSDTKDQTKETKEDFCVSGLCGQPRPGPTG